MVNALSEALRAEIDKRDAVHENLQMLDELIHSLLDMTKPLHTDDEDCHCGEGEEAHANHEPRNF